MTHNAPWIIYAFYSKLYKPKYHNAIPVAVANLEQSQAPWIEIKQRCMILFKDHFHSLEPEDTGL